MLFLAVVAYAPVAFMQYSLKWDMLDCYLPWRYFAADAFAHGTFPLWDPYQSLGYPIYGDLRSVFYPDAMLSGLFLGGFGIRTLHVLFIVHLALAGTGLYLLAGHFTRRTDARILAGSAYLLSGFFTGHGQEMFGIIGATWIPFILYHAVHVLQGDGRGGHPPKLALVLFLQLVGGYQALSIMLLYLLVVLAVVILGGRLRGGDRSVRKELLPRLALWGGAVVLSLAVLLVTYVDIGVHITRFAGMALEKAQFNPFPPKALITLLVPYAAVADSTAFGTDASMTNGYVGILPLMAFVFALFRRKTPLAHVMLGFGLLCLLASFGEHFPVREWLFEHAPLMDLFRMPSFFRYYAMVAILLLGVSELGRWLDKPDMGRRQVLRGAAGMASLLAVVLAFAWPGAPVWSNAWTSATPGPIAHHVWAQAPIQLLLLGMLALALLVLRRRTRALRPMLFVFLVVEMCVAVAMNLPVTVVSLDVPVAHVARMLKEQPVGAMVPDLRRPIAQNRDGRPELWPLWRNTGNYVKEVSSNGFNSFQIDAYRRLESERSDLFAAARNGPPLFLSYALCPEGRWATGGRLGHELVVGDSVQAVWSAMALRQGPNDRVQVERFEPGMVRSMVRVDAPAVLTLAQMDHPGWEVHVGGVRTPHAEGHTALISVLLEPGQHVVEFRFSKPAVVIAFVISYLMLALFIALAVYHTFREARGHEPRRAAILSSGMVGALLLFVAGAWALRPSYVEQVTRQISMVQKATNKALEHEGAMVFADVDRPDLLNTYRSTEYFRAEWPQDLARVGRRLMEQESAGAKSVLLVGRGAAVRPEVEEIFLNHFPQEERLLDGPGTYVRRYRKGEGRPSLHSTRQMFASEVPWWKYDGSKLEKDGAGGREGVWRIDPAQPGSPPFEARFGDIGAENAGRLVFSLDAMRSSPAADASLYIVIVRSGGEEWNMARRISSFVPDTLEWGRTILVARPPFKPRADDLIKAFVWNDGEEAVYLTDLRFEALAR